VAPPPLRERRLVLSEVEGTGHREIQRLHALHARFRFSEVLICYYRGRKHRVATKKGKQGDSAAKKVVSVSIHDHLSKPLAAFLSSSDFPKRQTQAALASLIGLLANYREEGHQLFPEVFVVQNLSSILKTLPNSESIAIGSGSKTHETLNLALKRCAPLAQWGWSIYILPTEEKFDYGMMRCGLVALSLSASEQLIDEGDKAIPAILIRQISNHTIEVSGPDQDRLRVHFGGAERPGLDPVNETVRFCNSIVTYVPNPLKEQVRTFYWRLFAAVLKGGHGCLAAILAPSKNKVPTQLRDCVLVAPRVDVAARVAELLGAQGRRSEADTRLRAAAALIRGMLLSDGVTLLHSDGSVLAYNVFVKNPKDIEGEPRTLGGARRRAFEALCTWLDKDLCSAYYLSQDGHAEFRGSKKWLRK
jgi:hypothetical protein